MVPPTNAVGGGGEEERGGEGGRETLHRRKHYDKAAATKYTVSKFPPRYNNSSDKINSHGY